MGEVWKDIQGYEGLYKISNKGEIKNAKTNNILKQYLSNRGYLRVTLFKKSKPKKFTVHRLVAENFIKNNYIQKEISELQINHKDGNRSNNNVENLEWCTAQENTYHALKNGLRKMKIPYSEHNNVCEKYRKGKIMKDIAKEYNVNTSTIRNILIHKKVKIRKKGDRGENGKIKI